MVVYVLGGYGCLSQMNELQFDSEQQQINEGYRLI